MNKLFLILLSLCLSLLSFRGIQEQDLQQTDPTVLIGTWKLDMSPEDPNDDNFAMMHIKKVKENAFFGTFYREGVPIREGRINTQRGIVYGALVSGDNSGEYNSTFYYKEGKLYGTTHSLSRDFLAVWIAEKE